MENNAGLTPEERQRAIELIADAELKKQSGDSPGKAVCDNGVARPLREFKPIKAISAAELDKEDISPIEWLIEDILPVGLLMTGAPSKSRKSYMALDVCISICTGTKFLGFHCNKHACLYFDLESTKRRPKSRLNQIMGDSSQKPDNLYIITGIDEPGRIGAGFEAQVEYQLKEHPDIKLIIVDVFQMIRQPAKKNQTGYDRDYDDFKILKQIADKHNIGVMLIHHTRKMRDPSDVFNELSGSVGVMGALDCAWVIAKDDRYSEEAALHITGRDMKPQQLKIKFNENTFRWECIGTAEEVQAQRLLTEYEQSPVVETIRKLVKQGNGHWEGSASDIVNASKYLSRQIYDDVRKVGKIISNFEELFFTVDEISYHIKPNNKKNVYIFHSTHSTNSTYSIDSTHSTNFSQMELDM